MAFERIQRLQHRYVFDPVQFHRSGNVHRMIFPCFRITVQGIDADFAVKLPFPDPSSEGLRISIEGFHGVQDFLSQLLGQLAAPVPVEGCAFPQVLPLVIPVGPFASQVGGVGE